MKRFFTVLFMALVLSGSAQVIPVIIGQDTITIDLGPYLADYVKQSEMDDALELKSTFTWVNSQLSNYVTRTELTDSLLNIGIPSGNYATIQDVNNSQDYVMGYVDSEINAVNTRIDNLTIGVPDNVLTYQDLIDYGNYCISGQAFTVFDKIAYDEGFLPVGDTIALAWFITEADTTYFAADPRDFANFISWIQKEREPIAPYAYEALYTWGEILNEVPE